MLLSMIEHAQLPLTKQPTTHLELAIAQQRELLTKLLTVHMFTMTQQIISLLDDRVSLELLLSREITTLTFCKYIYVLDKNANQISANVGHTEIDDSHFARNRAEREYMKKIIGFSDFRLSDAYISQNNKRPSITAVQVIRDQKNCLCGFLGADFDLRDLPHTGSIYNEVSQWRQLKGDPAIRSGLFYQCRVHSVVDQNIDQVLIQISELITGHGVFHSKLHFSSSRATIWLTQAPYHYQLLGVEELMNTDLCLAYSPTRYPENATIPSSQVTAILERFRMLRYMDENIYLRSASINIFNGVIGLNFSCDGSHYMDYREFLTKDTRFWLGERCDIYRH